MSARLIIQIPLDIRDLAELHPNKLSTLYTLKARDQIRRPNNLRKIKPELYFCAPAYLDLYLRMTVLPA